MTSRRARRAKTPPRRPKQASKALAVRKRPAVAPRPLLPAKVTSTLPTAVLDEAIQLGDFGLVEVKFTAQEEKVLDAAVDLHEVRVKPTGQVYLPHVAYTRWLNRAFGRTGWALRPASKPLINNNTVVVPYLLLVRGKPVAFALGEQEYFAENRDQSYGDALESTVASGLRRCCKHLGLALELWDREFGDRFLEQHCKRVKVETRDGKTRWQYRRREDAPFRGEVETGRRQVNEHETRPPARPATNIAEHPQIDDPINDAQLRKLWTSIRTRGREDGELRAYLGGLGYASTKQIRRRDFETILQAIEHPGPLIVREPGQEG